MATVILGGLVTSTLVNLFIVPVALPALGQEPGVGALQRLAPAAPPV